jgi:non-ribosomal peptide synthetase component E (peptide arylation enzyme)
MIEDCSPYSRLHVYDDEVGWWMKIKRGPYGETELLVRDPNTIRGLLQFTRYNKKAYQRWFLSQGTCEMYKGRYVTVEGRIKDTINGAEKISAES